MRQVAVLLAFAFAATTPAVPTLGRQWAPNQKGYGKVKPRTIDNGGDPTGLVDHVRWRRWGERRAIGSGFGYWVWPGQGVAGGSIRTRAVVVAYDLGRCRGRRAYRKIHWFFPKYGESFDPQWWYINICTGGEPRSMPSRKCGSVTVRSPRGRATDIEASSVTCRKARRIVASSPSVRYLHTGGRFRHAGLYCGTPGDRGAYPLFECARGRVDILYEVTGS